MESQVTFKNEGRVMNARARESGNATGTVIVFGGVFMMGWLLASLVAEKDLSEAMDWAVQQTEECERMARRQNFNSIAECLRDQISASESLRNESRHEPF